jgi:hypothetical protein
MSKNGKKIVIKSSKKKFHGECYLDVLETKEKTLAKIIHAFLSLKLVGPNPKWKQREWPVGEKEHKQQRKLF